jgi:Tfp pilus assembly protein PilN
VRPVNLIPPDERRGDSAPSRTGALSWVIVGGLAVVLVAVTAVVLLNKGISDKESEVATLERQEQELQARAQSLASFVDFKLAEEARTETISTLAETRFDWSRVMRELSRVLPNRTWLVNLTGTVSPEVTLEDGANVALRSSVEGPALELVGCARSQAVVGRLISAIGDVDGVTRVAVGRSEKPDDEVSSSGSNQELDDDCRTRSFLTKFELVAAFDSVAVPEAEAPAPAPPAADSGAATPAESSSDGGVSDAQQARSDTRQDTSDANANAQQAANIIPKAGG